MFVGAQLSEESRRQAGAGYEDAHAVFRVPKAQCWAELLRRLHKFFRSRTGRGLKNDESFVNAYDLLYIRFFGARAPLRFDFERSPVCLCVSVCVCV